MATIRKRGNSYQIRVSCGYNVSGEQITKTMTWKPTPGMTSRQIEKELERQAVLFQERCENGLYLSGNIKLSEFAEKWLSEYAEKQLKPRTFAEYKRLLERINTALGHIRIDKIQPHHLMEFYNNLAECGVRKDIKYKPSINFDEYMKNNNLRTSELAKNAGVSRTTIRCCRHGENVSYDTAMKIMNELQDNNLFIPEEANKTLSSTSVLKYHTLLSSVFSTAVKWQVILSNPCDRVEPPKKAKKEAHYIDEQQATQLIECLEREPLRYRTIIMLLLYSGMRRGELCGLEWSDIDFKNNLVSITKAGLYLPDRGVFDDTPKNKTSERVIKIPGEIIKLLKEYKREQTIQQVAMGDKWQGSGKVFTNDSGERIRPDSLTSWFSSFIKRNNLPHISLHSLRHTNATLLIAGGADIRTIAKRLGHSTPTTTGNIYLHAIKTADEIASDTLSDILNPVKRKKA